MSPRWNLLAVAFFVFTLLSGTIVRGNPTPADKPETWVEIQTQHFIVASNDGEKTARRVADQFEQIRFLYSRAFQSGIRIDPGIPILIFAVKNEKSLSQLIPEYWARKGHMHPAGLFVPGPEKNYIALRTDIEGDYPYLPIYHEYVHLIVNLNYQHLPTWLNEGFANFFGTATLGAKEGKLGQPNAGELYALSQTRLLPLDLLFKVDRKSPYYNEADKTNIFYAESWALVHYLMLDPQKRKDQVLSKYISLIENGGDPVEAAIQSFGDLAQMQKALQAYIAKPAYLEYVVTLPERSDSKDYSVRTISPAEVQARLGDYDLYRGQFDPARKKLEEAIRLDPNLPGAQESMGYLLYRQDQRDDADKYFSRAIELDSKSALAYYYHAMLLISDGADSKEKDDARTALEKAIALNPRLAPAWANLGMLYSQNPDTLDKALNATRHAVEAMPGEPYFQYDLAVVLARMERYDEARAIARKLQGSADPATATAAEQFLTRLDQAQRYSAYKKANEAPSSATPTVKQETKSRGDTSAPILRQRTRDETGPTTASSEPTLPPGSETVPASSSTPGYSMIGTITEVDCGGAPQMRITLKAQTLVMHLHAADVAQLAIKTAGSNSLAKTSCASLRGRSARISYLLVSGMKWDGEIQAVELRDQP